MDLDNLTEGLTEDQIAKAKECATPRELANLVKGDGFDLTDEQLELVTGGWGPTNENYMCPTCGEPLIFAIDKRWFCKTCFKFYDL